MPVEGEGYYVSGTRTPIYTHFACREDLAAGMVDPAAGGSLP